MDAIELLIETYGRIPELALSAVEGLDMAQLIEPPTAGANPIAWLVWHIGRVQDSQISPLVKVEQLWVTDGWATRFGLEPDPANSGYGNTADQVSAVRPESVEVLLAYLDAAQERSITFLRTVTDAELDRVIDERWTPHVTLGVRLVSIAGDCFEHAGQASYLRGLLSS